VETTSRGQDAVAMTWEVTFDQLCSSKEQSEREAAQLLGFVSLIEPKGIPQSLLPDPNGY
jgi:hypothetical protein